ncbi:hypothetical protein NMY22_g16839 [Coprinellus aureogranulatus]|nr:hypothetical protein NMY22_g16839 [Coprinellus aureogranulatus]
MAGVQRIAAKEDRRREELDVTPALLLTSHGSPFAWKEDESFVMVEGEKPVRQPEHRSISDKLAPVRSSREPHAYTNLGQADAEPSHSHSHGLGAGVENQEDPVRSTKNVTIGNEQPQTRTNSLEIIKNAKPFDSYAFHGNSSKPTSPFRSVPGSRGMEVMRTTLFAATMNEAEDDPFCGMFGRKARTCWWSWEDCFLSQLVTPASIRGTGANPLRGMPRSLVQSIGQGYKLWHTHSAVPDYQIKCAIPSAWEDVPHVLHLEIQHKDEFYSTSISSAPLTSTVEFWARLGPFSTPQSYSTPLHYTDDEICRHAPHRDVDSAIYSTSFVITKQANEERFLPPGTTLSKATSSFSVFRKPAVFRTR